MIHVGAVLLIGGAAGALWRLYGSNKRLKQSNALLSTEVLHENKLQRLDKKEAFDDVEELSHYQKIAWYALALSAAGSWFYPPARLLSFPLLGYNTIHFVRVIQNSDKSDQKSPMTVFEVLAIAGTLVTGNALAASTLMVLSFGSRKLLLHAGNLSNNVDFSRPINPRHARVWVLREGAEIESTVADLLDDDVVVLHAGDTVVVEGKVIEGNAYVRQFSLRKKLKQISKQQGDKVFPFTKLESGTLHIRPV